MPIEGKEMHGAKDGAAARSQGGSRAHLPIGGSGLVGLIEYQGIINKRQVGKGWGVMFVCSATSAVHVEFMDTYSMGSFLMALCRFMCIRGVPSRIQSDRGEQLVAASKHVSAWDPEGIREWARRKGIEWHLIPTGGQHFNGQAERMIGIIKKQIWRSSEGRKYTHEETTKYCKRPRK
jgi:hypothetical protein